ncbi:MAG: hypothetical protein V5A22_07230 [Salinivenus sp.]
MRSTNLVLFLICLNAAAAVIGVGVGAELGVQPQLGGSGEIASAEESVTEQTANTGGGALEGTLLGFVSVAGDVLTAVENVIFLAPNMFLNLGAPSILIDPFKVVLGFVVAFDVAEILSGRLLS